MMLGTSGARFSTSVISRASARRSPFEKRSRRGVTSMVLLQGESRRAGFEHAPGEVVLVRFEPEPCGKCQGKDSRRDGDAWRAVRGQRFEARHLDAGETAGSDVGE